MSTTGCHLAPFESSPHFTCSFLGSVPVLKFQKAVSTCACLLRFNSTLSSDVNITYYYLAGCTTFLHLPAPIWQLFLMGFLAIFLFFFLMSRGLACCINPQPGGPGDFWSRFSSCSPWYVSIKLQGSSASFGPPRVFYLVSIPLSATRGGAR